MVFTLNDFAKYAICGISYGGVLWLIISSLIGCITGKSTGPEPTTLKVEPSPEPTKDNNLIEDLEKAGLPAAEPLVAINEAANEASSAVAKAAKPRMYFLDNIKAFLTVVVICHHTIDDMRGAMDTGAAFCIINPAAIGQPGAPYNTKTVYSIFANWILTLNQSYFMAFFFFISGYFTPSSLDRKGVAGFLRDRFKRIGIPAVVYTSGLGPFQVWLSMTLGKNDPDVSYPGIGDMNNSYQYAGYTGQIWYLHWLVFFSFIYAFVHTLPVKMPTPQVGHVFLFAFAIGIWFVLKPIGGSDFAMMPLGVHSFFYYVLYFSAGILAKRNDWMSTIVNSGISKATTLFMWGLIAFIAIGVFIFCYSVSPFESEKDAAEAQSSTGMAMFIIGFFAVIICLAELQLFHAYFNKGGRISKFFCESAYAAYILHYIFVNFGIFIYFHMMKQWSGLPEDRFVGWQLGQQGTTFIVWDDVDGVNVGEQYTWYGMLFVCAFANLCVWPTAFFLRKLPLLNQVL
jgi:hypothetical protein